MIVWRDNEISIAHASEGGHIFLAIKLVKIESISSAEWDRFEREAKAIDNAPVDPGKA